MIFFRKTLPFLLLAFLMSVLVRVPELGRPLSKHHEFCTAVSLRILQIWYDNGLTAYNAEPVMTYNTATDKYINNDANASGRMIDEAGNYYYVSHPPFAYYFPYAIFKTLHIRPDVVPLQILNLFFHFLSALFVYFTVCLLSFNRARSYLHVPSFVAYCIYLFLPATLWFQGNVYMSDMAVQLPFIIGVYTVLKMIFRQRFYVPKYIVLYAAILFVMIYTSWLGVFFAFGVLVYSLLHVRSIPGFRVLIWSTVIITFFTLNLIIYQYAQIAGQEAYLHEVINRYLMRGSVGVRHQGFFYFFISYFFLFKDLIYNYLVNYLPVYLLIGAFMWLGATKAKLKIVFSENGYRFIWLSILPVVLMHIFFLQYSSHDFTVLYASLFFSVLLGILYDKVRKSGTFPDRTVNGLVLFTIMILIIQFYVTNLPGSHSISSAPYDREMKLGRSIQEQSAADEVIFTNMKPTPQMVFYAGRNMKEVASEQEAKDFLKQRKLTKGAYFDIRMYTEDAPVKHTITIP